MIRELRRSGMDRPAFGNFPNRFEVEFSSSELLDPVTRDWLDGLREPGLTQLHELALATMRHEHPVSNVVLREFGASHAEATAVLRDLVNRGLAVRTGGRRWATYALDEKPRAATDPVAAAMRAQRSARASELMKATGLSRPTVLARLEELVKEGSVTTEGSPRSPKRRYLWTGV